MSSERMEALGHDLPEDVKRRIFSFDQHPTATLIKPLQFTYHKPQWRTNRWYPAIKLRVSSTHDWRLCYCFTKRGRRPLRGMRFAGISESHFTPSPEQNPSPCITHRVRGLHFGPYPLDYFDPNHFGIENVITDGTTRWLHNIEDDDISEVSMTPDEDFNYFPEEFEESESLGSASDI